MELILNEVTFQWTNDINSEDFFFLYDALLEDCSGFSHNRTAILDGWKNGTLWMPKDVDCGDDSTAIMDIYKGIWGNDYEHFFTLSNTTLPTFFLFDLSDKDRVGVEPRIVWVHSKIRRQGIATSGMRQMKCVPAKIKNQLKGSEEFWRFVAQEKEE
jgi:hypothetical protein